MLAEYWLRVYETLEREAGAFRTVRPLCHQTFVSDPLSTLRDVERAAGLLPADYPRLAELQTDRNRLWPQLLTAEEQRSLDRFLEAHGERIARLTLAEAG